MSGTSDDKKSLTARNKSLHTHVVIAPKSATVFRPQCLQSPCNIQKNKMRIFQGSSFHRTLGNQGIVTPRNPKKRRFVAKNALIWGEADFTKAVTP